MGITNQGTFDLRQDQFRSGIRDRMGGQEPYQRLEKSFAEWCELPPEGMVVCSSGTAALHLATECLGLPIGSDVLLPNLTMVACARAVAMAGMNSVFVDCQDDLNMNWRLVGGDDPPAFLLVHIYGRKCDIQGVRGRFRSSLIIEDLAEAHGVGPHHQTNAACWSFFKNKLVAGEEGGAVWFKDNAHANLARQLRSLGFTDKHDFMHVPRGHNYRLSNAHAELVLRSLASVDRNIAERRKVEAMYDALCPQAWKMPPRESPWVYDVRIPGLTVLKQDEIVNRLKIEGIQARYCFKPMSWQPEFQKCRTVGGNNAGLAAKEVIYLPLVGVNEAIAKRAFEIITCVVSSK